MIEAQIQYAKIQAIGRQMGENLQRISRSPLVSQDRSFATAILTGELQVAVQHQYEPEHLFAIKESVKQLFDYFAYDITEGDVLLVADPYSGGTKGQTLTMAAPLFHQGEIVLFPVVRVQMTDLAGEYPGGYHPNAFEVWQESMRITPVKLYKQGILQRDVLRFLLANSRVASLYESELQAMYACLSTAKQQIDALVNQHNNLLDAVEAMISYSKKRVIDHSNQLPTTQMSSVVLFKADDQTLSIHASIQRTEEQITIDFHGTDRQVSHPINSVLATTKAFAAWPLLAPLEEELAFNDGTLEPFQITAPSGSLLNPNFPAAVGFSATITGHFISEAVSKALRDQDVKEEAYGNIHGPGPQAILFPPFGKNKETEPIFLVPGYPESNSSWGPSGLYGNRKLVSAEELELYYGFKIIKREMEDSKMVVRLVNKGADYYVNLIIPENEQNQYGTVTIFSKDIEEKFQKSVTGKLLKSGDEIEFEYAREGGK